MKGPNSPHLVTGPNSAQLVTGLNSTQLVTGPSSTQLVTEPNSTQLVTGSNSTQPVTGPSSTQLESVLLLVELNCCHADHSDKRCRKPTKLSTRNGFRRQLIPHLGQCHSLPERFDDSVACKFRWWSRRWPFFLLEYDLMLSSDCEPNWPQLFPSTVCTFDKTWPTCNLWLQILKLLFVQPYHHL